ncbi:hypothetical protein [Achromobacter dolens]|uniref:hypothetical protein n=1 Tax=Achromobacter dolens TaxID=1287738 RepID=UPI0031D77AC6
MRERPILFSGPMVRAILAGHKTQTRRVVKPWEPGYPTSVPKALPADFSMLPDGTSFRATCPYGQPGDRLWVREAFRFAASLDRLPPNDVGEKALDAGYNTPWAPTQFEADGHRTGSWRGFDTPPAVTTPGKLRPGIHMPRWVCRLVLEITSVRVERLQDIDENDAIAEGIDLDQLDESQERYDMVADHNMVGRPTAIGAYRNLWESINGAGAWDANPWVWVVEFRRANTDKKEM